MLTRWIIRIAFFSGMIGVAAVAGAQSKAGGGAAPTPGGGGGGAAAPAPPPRTAPPSGKAPSGGAQKSDDPKPAPQPAPPAPVRPAPPVINPPANTAAPQNRITSDPNRPRSAVEAQREAERQRQLQDQNRNQSENQNQNRQFIFIGSRWLNNWGPYAWWSSGTSYWWPPMDGSYDRRNDGYYPDSTASSGTRTPAADLPTPTQVQAQSVNQLEGIPEYRQLVAELKKAQNEYEAASRRAVEKVKSTQEYQALLKQRDQAENQVEAVQAGAKIPPSAERVTPAAERKLNVSSKITRMEQDAIAADPQASAAKAHMVDLNERLTAMRKQAQANQAQSVQTR